MHGRYLAGMASANTLTRNFLPTDGFWPERSHRSLVRERQLPLQNRHPSSNIERRLWVVSGPVLGSQKGAG